MAIKDLHWDFCLIQSHIGMVTTANVIMIILLWPQCSAKAMVLKWPYAFQTSRFVKHRIITAGGFLTVLSCLSVFTKGTRALQNKILLCCASLRKFTLLLCHIHLLHCSHSSLRALPVCPWGHFPTAALEMPPAFTIRLLAGSISHKQCSTTASQTPLLHTACTWGAECHLNTPHQFQPQAPFNQVLKEPFIPLHSHIFILCVDFPLQ